MAPLAALSVAVASFVLAGCARVTCDRFNVQADLQEGTLTVCIDTDLPDDTDVEVSVSRLVHAKSEAGPCAIHYLSDKGKLSEWRSPRTVSLDHAEWWRELEERQRTGGESGEPFEVSRIEPTIRLEVLVPVNQSDERFGDGNFNLRGEAVQLEGNWRVIRKTLEFDCPLAGEAD